MLRRFICLVIIATMMTHCAARLGVLSYLYEKRHDIALSVGLISEIPIALCSHNYDFGNGLILNDSSDEQKAPPSFSTTHEIILFVPSTSCSININWRCFTLEKIVSIQPTFESTYLFDIFHPPSLHS